MEKRGSLFRVTVRGRQYWRAVYSVDGRQVKRQSRDRAVVERWLEGMRAEHPGRAPRGLVAGPLEPRVRRRTGCLQVIEGRMRPRYVAYIKVDGVMSKLYTRDRAEAERWLAERVAENPTYTIPHGTGRPKPAEPKPAVPKPEPKPAEPWPAPHIPGPNPFAGSRRPAVAETPSLWVVVAETNPNTSLMLCRRFKRMPSKVLVTDIVDGTPIVWVADDNGGEGFGSEAEARERMEAMRGGTDPSVGLGVRPLSRSY